MSWLSHNLCKFLVYPKKNKQKYTLLSRSIRGQRDYTISPLLNFVNATYMFSLISGQTFFLVSWSSSHDIVLHVSSFFTKWWLLFSISYCKNIYSWSEVASQKHCPYMWVSIFLMKRLCQQVFVPLELFIKKNVTTPVCAFQLSAQRQLWKKCVPMRKGYAANT